MTAQRLAYSVRDAAHEAGVSENYVRAAIKSPGGPGYPPPLKAKFVGGRAGYRREDGVEVCRVELVLGAPDRGGEATKIGGQGLRDGRGIECRGLLEPPHESVGPEIIGTGSIEARHEPELLHPMIGQFRGERRRQRKGFVRPPSWHGPDGARRDSGSLFGG